MQLYSTRNPNKKVSLKEAAIKGLAEDGGLFMPESIPVLPLDFIQNIEKYSPQEIAFEVSKTLIGNDVPEDKLKEIVYEAFNFPVPGVKVEENIYSLELFHGPTMAFKDVGARFMSRLMSYFYQGDLRELKVVVATSGDTGSAVASGFFNVPGIKVYILYPKGKVSFLQEKQLSTWGGNITAIEVEGTFDDCQALAKQILSDKELNKKFFLTSANSINIARLIPQSFYYFCAYAQLKELNKPMVFSVPSGNYGNITGGFIAKKMGLPIEHFIAASNANDIVPQYLKSGKYEPKPSVQTISNAMDVGTPSNFERLKELFKNHETFKSEISGFSFSDSQTKEMMKRVFEETKYMLDPHGAVAYLGLKEYLKSQSEEVVGVFLETAHPAKFIDVVEEVLHQKIEIPEKLQAFAEKEKKSIPIPNQYSSLISIIERDNK